MFMIMTGKSLTERYKTLGIFIIFLLIRYNSRLSAMMKIILAKTKFANVTKLSWFRLRKNQKLQVAELPILVVAR